MKNYEKEKLVMFVIYFSAVLVLIFSVWNMYLILNGEQIETKIEDTNPIFIHNILIICCLFGLFATCKWYIWKRKWYKLMRDYNEIKFEELKRINKDILKSKKDE